MRLGLQTLKRVELSDATAEVVEQLRDRIIRTQLPEGTPLVERDLCEQLGVSRTPVREALHRLRDEGLIVPRGRRGLAVSQLSESEARSLYGLIARIEGFVVEGISRVPPDTIAEMNGILDTQREGDLSVGRYLDLDRRFHDAFLVLPGNEIAVDTLERLRTRARRYEWTYFQQPGSFATSYRDHAVIVSLLRDGRSEAAAEAIEAHWLSCLDYLLGLMRGPE